MATRHSDPGQAESRVVEAGRRYTARIRVLTGIPIGIVAVASADGERMRVLSLVAVLAISGWSAIYIWGLGLGRGLSRLVTSLDSLALIGLAAATPHLVAVDWLEHQRSWIRPFAVFAAVAYQYSTTWFLGCTLGAFVCLGVGVSTQLALHTSPGLDSLITGVWSFAVALLARGLWALVVRGARHADDEMRRAAKMRQAEAVAAEVRADQHAVTDALHDSSASTLLMVGLGQAVGLGQILRDRAAKDLSILRSINHEEERQEETAPQAIDLRDALESLRRYSPVSLRLDGPQAALVPSAVGLALSNAAAEAVTNVGRHSGQETAEITLDVRPDGGINLNIADHGRGFDTNQVEAGRRGISRSIQERMIAVGGRAEIRSAPGEGTVVHLEWHGQGE